MAGISGVGQAGSDQWALAPIDARKTRQTRTIEQPPQGHQVREAVREAKSQFRAEGGARNQGQAIAAALRALRQGAESVADDAIDDEAPGTPVDAIDGGTDADVLEAPLSTQETLDLFA